MQPKALLFTKLRHCGDAIINGSDEHSSAFQTTAETREAIVSLYSLADVTNIKMSNSGTVFEYTFFGESKPTQIQSRLIGNYNLENMLAAIRAAEALGIKSEFIRMGIRELSQIPGR
ncbi:MAG TPA: hypothetical protein EYQ00_11695, partial [Dehalococcoidia bacterium]|nr:hypothetical protein [Dehalococcoidia bacterium]